MALVDPRQGEHHARKTRPEGATANNNRNQVPLALLTQLLTL